MGRAFEYRKARKLKRWGNMARTFTKIGKEIEIAVKSGGPDPTANVRLRILIQNAKAENMPKENVERAIKRAISKDTSDYKEVVYEGYGPHGIAFLVETATDNTNRTVASMRMYFNKCGGALGTSGSVAFMFEHKCSFKFRVPAGTDFEELELNMIDTGWTISVPRTRRRSRSKRPTNSSVRSRNGWRTMVSRSYRANRCGCLPTPRSWTPRGANRSRSWSRSSKRTTTW